MYTLHKDFRTEISTKLHSDSHINTAVSYAFVHITKGQRKPLIGPFQNEMKVTLSRHYKMSETVLKSTL